jgi:hypothetical protein
MTIGPSDSSAAMMGRRPAFQELRDKHTGQRRHAKTAASSLTVYAQESGGNCELHKALL